MKILIALAGVLCGLAVAAPLPSDAGRPEWERAKCVVTSPVDAEPLGDHGVRSFAGSAGTWYANSGRTIWAGGEVTRMYAGTRGNKVAWIRPLGTTLIVSGRRLDGESAPLEAGIPCCYFGIFQASGLILPTEGCWEITAKAGEEDLRFITRVKPDSASDEPRPRR